MLTVEQAQQCIAEHAHPLSAETLPMATPILGRVLAENVASDIDMPPYDKALMDGYAVRSMDITSDETTFSVVEDILAGHVPRKTVEVGQASRIMTGAAMPSGANAVVVAERTESAYGERVLIRDSSVKPGQNVLPLGREMKKGEIVLHAGAVLRPQEFGILATVGKVAVPVIRQPVVAMLSTGDEVVEPSAAPGPGQIRNSNAAMLLAQIARAGGAHRYIGIARDTVESLRPLIADGLKSDVFILSGGVSAGKVDLVPQVLQELGVQPIFHKIRMKPGKPLFFGVKEKTLVFGLPGNPVSSLVGFELFVRSAIRRLSGHADADALIVTASLKETFTYSTDRPTYHPARLEMSDVGWAVTPVPWFGSADLRAISAANAFVILSPDQSRYEKGSQMKVLAAEL